MKLLIFICALAAVKAAKLNGFGHSSQQGQGVPLPTIANGDASVSENLFYSAPSNQDFAQVSNSISSGPRESFGQSSSVSQEPNFSGSAAQSNPSQEYSEPSNQLGSGSSGSNSQIVAAVPTQAYSIPVNQLGSGSQGQSSNGFSSSTNTGSIGQSLNGISGSVSSAQSSQPTQSYSGPTTQVNTGSISQSSFQTQPSQPTQSPATFSAHSKSALNVPQNAQPSQTYSRPSSQFNSGSAVQSNNGFTSSSVQAPSPQPSRGSTTSFGQSFNGNSRPSFQAQSTQTSGQSFNGNRRPSSQAQPVQSAQSSQSYSGSSSQAPVVSNGQLSIGNFGSSFQAQPAQPIQFTQSYTEPSSQEPIVSNGQTSIANSRPSFQAQSAQPIQPAQSYSRPSSQAPVVSNGQSSIGNSRPSFQAQSSQPIQPAQSYSGPSSQQPVASNGQTSIANSRPSFQAQSSQPIQPAQSYSGPSSQQNVVSNGQSSGDFSGSISQTQTNQIIDPSFQRQSEQVSSGSVGSNDQSFAVVQQSISVSSDRSQAGVSREINYDSNTQSLTDDSQNICQNGEVLHVDGSCVTPEVTRHVFVYAAPERENEVPVEVPDIPLPKEEHNIVFIRAPEDVPEQDPIIVPPPQKKHIIYVLNKDSGNQAPKVIEVPAPEKQSPEVYFVNYADGENPTLPDGIDFQTALDSAIESGSRIIASGELSGITDSFSTGNAGQLGANVGFGNGNGNGIGNNLINGNNVVGSTSEISSNGFNGNIPGPTSFSNGGFQIVADSAESFDENSIFVSEVGNSGNQGSSSGVPLPIGNRGNNFNGGSSPGVPLPNVNGGGNFNGANGVPLPNVNGGGNFNGANGVPLPNVNGGGNFNGANGVPLPNGIYTY